MFDISKPAEPREIAFMPIDGLGLHRLWYVGGRYAYASCHWQGFTDHVLAIIDMQNPERPEVVGRWWLPGMHTAGGETPSWSGKRYALHHAIVAGNLAYAAWRDGGMTILDVADPTAPKLLVAPQLEPAVRRRHPYAAAAARPQPRGLSPTRAISTIAPTASSAAGCSMCATRPTRCRSPTLPTPAEADYCAQGRQVRPAQPARKPARLAADRGADLRAPIRTPGCGCSTFATRSSRARSAHFVPPPPAKMVDPRPNRPRVIQSNDCYVGPDGLMYVTDVNAGLTILQYKG